ncbi:MAG: hypothetical protein H6741_29350 [Alphaproteobacteria bacterium]|nr:hypothetical protein [Alphaproteobacteria bacterium]MCB9796827.1 hypothetical protein [Alphaproteobacteria bacterium]
MRAWLLLAWLSGAAFAQETPPDDEDAPGMEVVIRETPNVTKARADVDLKLEDLGYRKGIHLGRRTLYVNVQPWKPIVILFEEGFVRVHGHSVTPMAILPRPQTPDGQPTKVYIEAVGVFGNPRATRALEGRVVRELHPWVRDWQDAISAEAQAWRKEELRQLARAIWEQGVAPDGAALEEPSARRMALAELWLYTADNSAGAEARAIVMDYIDQVVQRSGAPYTEAELEHVNARRGFGAEFWPRPQ